MLNIIVTNEKQNQQFEHQAGPLEFGRGPERNKIRRFMIEDIFVSRDQLHVEERPEGFVLIRNLSEKRAVSLADGSTLPIGAAREVKLPLRLTVGKTLIDLSSGPIDSVDRDSLMTISQPLGASGLKQPLPSLHDLGDSPAPEMLAHWLEGVISLQRTAVAPSELCDRAARAMVNLIGLDSGMVILRRDETWDIVARHFVEGARRINYSRTLLTHVVQEKRTFYQDLTSWGGQGSLSDVDAAVVSPIFGLHDEVVGVLYGLRQRKPTPRGGGIRPLEAQVVQLLAAAVGASLARAVASRARVQFEQFFSPELVRELERDPGMLEGRNQEVTILVSDLRGFSNLSERLGPANTCKLVRDMMERLTERIVEHGGVIVDYAGDGILAMWNAPARQEDHAMKACQAALRMLDELPGLNERWQEVVGGPLALGIGINTGPVQVGNTGSSRKFKYGPHGHTVNLASRVQDATKRLGLPLLITGSTRQQLADNAFVTRRLCQVRVTGIAAPVMLYELHGEMATREWLARRDAYEAGLLQFESRQWAKACQTLIPLLQLSGEGARYDTPTLRLMRRAWECLESPPPEPFDPSMECNTK
jgi:adenylate cyclase